MKRISLLAVLFVFIFAFVAVVAFAADTTTVKQDTQQYRMQIGNKAERGVKNVLFGWTEVPKKIVDITKETRNPLWGALAGTWQGGCDAFARTASGVVDVATCGIKNTEKPMVETTMNTVPAAGTK